MSESKWWPQTGLSTTKVKQKIAEMRESCSVNWWTKHCKALGYPGTGITAIVHWALSFFARYNINRIGMHLGEPDGKPPELGFEGGQALEATVGNWMIELAGGRDEEPLSFNLEACGTAANLQGMRIGRNYLASELSSPRDWSTKIALITTVVAHFSIMKSAEILGFQLPPNQDEPQDKYTNVLHVSTDANGKIDLDALKGGVNDLYERGFRGFLIVATAGSTLTGSVDAVKEIRDLMDVKKREWSEDCKFYLHVDAAFGGFVLPFLDTPVLFGFNVGADSVVIDPHKMGGVPFGCGAFMCRQKYVKYAKVEAPYVNSEVDYTFAGSGNAAFAAACYASMASRGWDGFVARTANCLRMRDHLVTKLEAIQAKHNLNCWEILTGTTNQVCLLLDDKPDEELAKMLEEYYLHAAEVPANFSEPYDPNHRYAVKFVCMPHVTRALIDNFAQQLEGHLMSAPTSQLAPSEIRDQILNESFEALQSEICPTRLTELIERVQLVIVSGVSGNEVLVWQNRLADLQERHAELNSTWSEHKNSCPACIKANHICGAT